MFVVTLFMAQERDKSHLSAVMGVANSKVEAEEIVARYSSKTLRSHHEETEKGRDSEENRIWIWEDECGENYFIITEVQ